METWLSCREQFRLNKAEGLRSVRRSAALDYGEMWHWMIGRWLQKKASNVSVKKSIELYEAIFKEANPDCPFDRFEDMQHSLLKFAAMWPFYEKKFAEDRTLRWVGVEQEFRVMYTYPDGFQVPINGILDGCVDLNGDELALAEHKTKSVIEHREISGALHLDNQVMTYLWVAGQLYGKFPSTIIYNVIFNPKRKPHQNEKWSDFVERLAEIVDKEEDRYFVRWELPVSKKMILRWKKAQLDPIMQDIRNWVEGGPHYVNTKALIGRYGYCPMFGVITERSFVDVYRRPLQKKERER